MFFRFISKKYTLLIIIFFLAILFSHQYVLKKIGYFLIYEQKPQKADLIVVLNGRDAERSLAAVDLYNQGYAGLIIMAGLVKQPGSDEFWKRVGNNFKQNFFFQKAIEAMGVPSNAFKPIGNGVTSTYDEAIATRQFLKENGYKSILIVTSKWHSRRAYLTFKSVIKDDGIKVWIYPSKYDTFDPNVWWKSENNIELIVDEYIRFIYYIVSFRISPFEIIN